MFAERCSGTIIPIPFDQHEIDAFFYGRTTDNTQLEERPAILRLHGILGNLLDDTEHEIPSILASEGFSSLTMNTLLANLGLFFGFGVFDDIMPQIDKARDFLRNQGFKKIVVAGHGLGGCMAIRYAALQSDPGKSSAIDGVIAIATPYSLPETIRLRWKKHGSQPSYDEIYRRAKDNFAPVFGEEVPRDESFVSSREYFPTRT